MPIRTVATHRDVRAPQWPASAAQFSSADGLRRVAGVAALIALDICSFVAAVILVPPASGMGWIVLWQGLSWWDVAIACAALVAVAALSGLYGRRPVRHSVRKIASAWGAAFIATLALMLVIDPVGIGARYVVAWIWAAIISLAARYAFDMLISLYYGADGDAPPALLLGSRESCALALATLSSVAPKDCVRVTGLVVPEDELRRGSGRSTAHPVVGSTAHLNEALARTGVSQVILADPGSLNGQLQGVIDSCRLAGVTLKALSPGLIQHPDVVAYIPGLDCPLFVVRPQPAGAGSYLVKRIMDRVGSALLLVLLSPLILFIAVLIKLTSPGPVFFVEPRIGVGQREFLFYKFRTMVANAREVQGALEELNEADGALFKVRDDPRITRVGRALRRLSLDEIPQLFNVLKGDMSLVGPRPLPLRDCELMATWDRRRHIMLPGITGLWQVSGRSDLSFDDMVRLDLQYMETWSLKSDLYIIWRTAGAVLKSRGAY